VPFSQKHADIACNFFEKLLKHTQDQWAGKPFLLAPWQEEALTEIFGQLDDDGNRLITQAYLEVPKKAGKTEFCAGLVLLVLWLNKMLGCQVYGAAAAQRQALNVYRAARTMVELSPPLKSQFKVLASTSRIIKRSDPNSFYAAVAADGDLSDGVNPACTIADEVHRWRTRKQLENWDVLTKGGITRQETLSVGVTTAGVENESPLAWQLHEKTERITQKIFTDPKFYGRIYGADKKDDWTKEETWVKANPSLKERGGFLDISKIREQYNSSLTDPSSQRSFRRYFLNLWDQKENRCIDLEKWDACKGDWAARGLLKKPPEDKVRPLPHNLLKHFIGQVCFPGVDLSMTTDMSSVTFVFPCADGYFDLLPFFWMPEAGLRKRELRDGMPYRTWAEQGFLELSPGNAIDYRDGKARMLWGTQMFDVREMCFDPYNSREMSVQLIDEGFECVEISQGYNAMNAPCKKLLELVATGKLRHGGHPILRWNAMCLSTEERNDLLKFVKPARQKDSSRIDGITAAVDGLARAILHIPDGAPTVEVWG
jgi:phage terminase large subunit-like protein